MSDFCGYHFTTFCFTIYTSAVALASIIHAFNGGQRSGELDKAMEIFHDEMAQRSDLDMSAAFECGDQL